MRRLTGPVWCGTALALVSLALYAATLAPTVLWGDDAELARLAATGKAVYGPHDHPLWLGLARLWVHLPLRDVAWRTNLLSAVFAALAVGLVFAAAFRMTRSVPAAIVGALAFAVSHTFWLHAVRTEVYTLYAALLAALVWLLLLWRERGGLRLLLLVAIVAGVAVWSHLLVFTALPAVAFLVARRRPPVRRASLALAAAVFAIIALPLVIRATSPGASVFGHGALQMPRARDLALVAGFLAYQFPFSLPLAIIGARGVYMRDRNTFVFLVLLIAGDVAFTLSFPVPDQYVFLLPAYLAIALWVADGWTEFRHVVGMRKPLAWSAAALVVVGPVIVYRVTPSILTTARIDLLSPRTLPYRDNNRFFLYPPKGGERGARRYGEQAFRDLPAGAVVMADWLPLETLRYLRDVEGMRRDVDLVEAPGNMRNQVPLLDSLARLRPTFLGDLEPRYYAVPAIERAFHVEQLGVVYRLQPLRSDVSGTAGTRKRP